MKKIILTSLVLSLMASTAFAAVPSASVVSVETFDCGMGKYKVNLNVNFPQTSQLIKIWVDGQFVWQATSGATVGIGAGDNAVSLVLNLTAGAHSLKTLASGEESVQAFSVSDCNAGGGGLHPCQVAGTCPGYGFTIYELEKGYCTLCRWQDEAKDPQYAIKKQLVALLSQLVELLKLRLEGR